MITLKNLKRGLKYYSFIVENWGENIFLSSVNKIKDIEDFKIYLNRHQDLNSFSSLEIQNLLNQFEVLKCL